MRLATVVAIMLTLTMSAFAKKPSFTAKEKEKIEKEYKKDAKRLAKEAKKQGYQFEQTGLPENLIYNVLCDAKLNGLQEQIGTAEKSQSRSKARQYAKTMAAREFAQEQSSTIKGKLDGMSTNEETEAVDRFVDQFEARYAMQIAGMLKVGYSKYRNNDDGTVDMEIHFLIDPENCQQIRMAAARQALELQKLNQEWAQRISDALKDVEEE